MNSSHFIFLSSLKFKDIALFCRRSFCNVVAWRIFIPDVRCAKQNTVRYLREKDMENFIFELIPSLKQLANSKEGYSLLEGFYPFYVFTAVRKFFFFLDPKKKGRVYIRDLLCSKYLSDLYELRQDPTENQLTEEDLDKNWFSMQSAVKIYRVYLDLDADRNGLLSPNELMMYILTFSYLEFGSFLL